MDIVGVHKQASVREAARRGRVAVRGRRVQAPLSPVSPRGVVGSERAALIVSIRGEKLVSPGHEAVGSGRQLAVLVEDGGGGGGRGDRHTCVHPPVVGRCGLEGSLWRPASLWVVSTCCISARSLQRHKLIGQRSDIGGGPDGRAV